MRLNRRDAISLSLMAGMELVTSRSTPGDTQARRAVEEVPFVDEGQVALNTVQGEELDGRLYTDLSDITEPSQITPADRFYIRTRASRVLPNPAGWRVRIGGLVVRAKDLSALDLSRAAEPMGRHVMECSGNNRGARFGLLSVTDWAGVRLAKLIEGARPLRTAKRVLIAGFDEYTLPSMNSIPGASWILTLEQVSSNNAFLATHMAGMPLTPDHGSPVRLVIPGWYGCACIKWVQEVTLVDDDVESTEQMKEFASRTGQQGIPKFAREYRPASIGLAAMPIRIEKWRVGNRFEYEVTGICWGGTRPLPELRIRFNPEEDYIPVDHFQQRPTDPWTVWKHVWVPKAPGSYLIHLSAKGEPRGSRLESGYYVRKVEITDV
jgi:DMSO/TMAO reductase YedYZ molybdopterin-dependent catalytic subunit